MDPPPIGIDRERAQMARFATGRQRVTTVRAPTPRLRHLSLELLSTVMTRLAVISLCLLGAPLVSAFVAAPQVRPAVRRDGVSTVAPAPLPIAATPADGMARVSPATSPVMGLFGLGTPEIAIIAGVALLVLGPDQVKKLAKDVGKISAELKQVPEEFNKGMEVGQEELAKKKMAPAADEETQTPPPTPPPAA